MNEAKHTLHTLLLLILFPFTLSFAGEQLYGVSAHTPGAGRLFSVDIETGRVRVIGPAGMGANVVNSVGLAARPRDGELFVDVNSSSLVPSSAPSGLYKLDRLTGTASLVGNDNSLLNELAFDTNDTLYTQIVSSNPGDIGPLGIVDTATGIVTELGGPDLPRLFALAFNESDSLLYGLAPFDSTLYRIRSDGLLDSTVELSSPISILGAFALTHSGKLVGSNLSSQLFDIDPTTGTVGNFRDIPRGYKPQGLARIPIPEPTAVAIVFCAAISAHLRFRQICKTV